MELVCVLAPGFGGESGPRGPGMWIVDCVFSGILAGMWIVNFSVVLPGIWIVDCVFFWSLGWNVDCGLWFFWSLGTTPQARPQKKNNNPQSTFQPRLQKKTQSTIHISGKTTEKIHNPQSTFQPRSQKKQQSIFNIPDKTLEKTTNHQMHSDFPGG